jgi:hypothetical protein
MRSAKGSEPWRVRLDEEAHRGALAKINELYPLEEGKDPSPARLDMLGWYRQWVLDLTRDPFRVLGAPPLRTDHPDIARFPADERVPVSGIAELDRSSRSITVIAVHIRPPRRRH